MLINFFLAVFFSAATPGSQNGSPSNQATPQTQTAPVDVCANLSKKEHKTLASSLTGSVRILFCSIFDDVQRDKAVAYTKQKKPLSPNDAVTQVGKDSGLLFNPVPGGACPAG
jgi:hypothetical protein